MGSSTSTQFGPKSTAEEVANAFDERAKGKYVIVTGGSGGLGLETARVLVKHGANVTVTCRTEKQGNDVVQKIKDELGADATISFGTMSLDDLTTIKSFAESYISSGKALHILVNNAGVMANPFEKTKQGFEYQLGVNHIGHFYLTKLLLPVLARSGTPSNKSRVVNVASLANFLYAPEGGILWDDLSGEGNYDKWERYGQSKLANILFANEINKRCADAKQNVVGVALHPGAILESDLMRHNNLLGTVWENIAFNWHTPSKVINIFTTAQKNIAEGAATTVVCALDPNLKPGKWYIDCNETLEDLHPCANDEAIASRLWDVTEDLIKPYL
jgi:NAD(P)-dependent dehydrogenase (short-subunit alcohol dehydrogenase family)